MSEIWERELDEPRRNVVHKCDCCGCDICVGDEAYSVDDYNWYCTDCCGLTEVEEPEPDWDFERKARLEDAEL